MSDLIYLSITLSRLDIYSIRDISYAKIACPDQNEAAIGKAQILF